MCFSTKHFIFFLYSCSCLFIKRCGMHIAHAVLEVNASLNVFFWQKLAYFYSFLFLQCDSHIGIVFLIVTCFAKHELWLLVMIMTDNERCQCPIQTNACLFSHSHTHSKKLREHHACKWGWLKIIHLVNLVKHIIMDLITNIYTHRSQRHIISLTLLATQNRLVLHI